MMRIIKSIQISCFILSFIFIHNIMAASAPVITINVHNPANIPLAFYYNNGHKNVCISLSPNLIQCTIYNKQVVGFVLNLSWVNLKQINCGENVLLYGSGNNYLFQFTSTYRGSSFVPKQWDGHSNINATLEVGYRKCSFIR